MTQTSRRCAPPLDVGRQCKKLMHIRSVMLAVGFCVLVVLSKGQTQGQGTLLYSNARDGGPAPPGLVLGDGQLVGMRFQLSSTSIIDGIGGNIQISGPTGDGRIFGALVRLSDMNDYPDSTNLTTSDVLAAVAFSASPVVTDVATPISPLVLEPGIYGLVLGSGLFGASSIGSMSLNNPNFADSSTFVYNTFDNVWNEYGSGGGLRFTVYGSPVPEPQPFALALLTTLILFLRTWSRQNLRR